jgi:hypothetical protein
MTTLPEPPKDGVELSFDPIHEGWSIYKTADGVLVKVRQVMMRILLANVKEDGTGQLAAGGSILFAVSAPQQLKGIPDPRQMTHEQITEAIVDLAVQFETVREDWSEYDVEGIKVGLKLVVTNIARSSLFDANGEPVYNVNYQLIVRPITSAEDKAKLKKVWDERGPAKAPTSQPQPKAP